MAADPDPKPVSPLNAQILAFVEEAQALAGEAASSTARGLALQALAHATALAMANAAQAQAQMQQIATAATAAVIAEIERAGVATR